MTERQSLGSKFLQDYGLFSFNVLSHIVLAMIACTPPLRVILASGNRMRIRMICRVGITSSKDQDCCTDHALNMTQVDSRPAW